MKERTCFRCGRVLDFESYLKNASLRDKEYLTKIWNNDHIEFFCCHCYCFKIKYQPSLNSEDYF